MIIRKKYGWSGYADGLFWIVNPHDYSLIVSEWLKGTPFSEKDNYHLIALSGFGDMYLWGEETANSLLINSSLGHFYPANKSSLINSDGEMDKLANFFATKSKERLDFGDVNGKPLFKRAKALLGELQYVEICGFSPAFTMGGSPTIDNLKKVNAKAHLLFLSSVVAKEEKIDIFLFVNNLGED